mgnify:CR=1 FL=1
MCLLRHSISSHLNMNQFPSFFTLAMIGSSHNQMSHSLLCTQSRHCLYLLHIFLNQTIFSSCRYIVVVPTAISRSLKYSLISCTVTCCPCTDCRKVCYSVICFILYLAFAILTSPFQFGNHFLNYLH